ncbi:hypothetical protein ACP70R_032341 [Stipagrostis hirtigluma subsp. patula]
MASSKLSVALLVAALAAAAAWTAAGADCGRKVLVQNLCDHELTLTSAVRANSPPLFPGGAYKLPPGRHVEFPVCTWSGVLSAGGAPAAECHLGTDGAWYRAPNANPGLLAMSITPHTRSGALQGHCPAVGCRKGGQCFRHDEAGGNCSNADEIKIIYCQP